MCKTFIAKTLMAQSILKTPVVQPAIRKVSARDAGNCEGAGHRDSAG
jgi:hypothetical protein